MNDAENYQVQVRPRPSHSRPFLPLSFSLPLTLFMPLFLRPSLLFPLPRLSHWHPPRLEKTVRHYGLLKFLRRAAHASALRAAGGPHAVIRPGRGRRASDELRRISRTHLHPPRGVRRAPLGARGVLGGVQRARPRAGASRMARG